MSEKIVLFLDADLKRVLDAEERFVASIKRFKSGVKKIERQAKCLGVGEVSNA